MKNQKQLSMDDLLRIRETYKHFRSTSDFIRVIDELIAIRESVKINIELPLAVSAGGQGYREQVIQILEELGIKVTEGDEL